jgi:serine/threonine-protein kinase
MVAGKYQLMRQIGAKDGTTTFVARDDRGTTAVVEMTRAGGPDHFIRLQQRARAVAGLDHAELPRIYSFGAHDGTYYLAREYVHGVNLKTLAAGGPTRPLQAARYVMQVCEALWTAHAQGIVHGDIRPHNLILTREGTVKLLEWAMPTSSGELAARTSGAPEFWHYASPEEVHGKKLTPASDIYSLGVVLYELVTGRVPFDGHTAQEVRRKHVEQYPHAPSHLNVNVPCELEGIIMRALAKNPGFRTASAEVMLWDLWAFVRGVQAGGVQVAAGPQPEDEQQRAQGLGSLRYS